MVKNDTSWAILLKNFSFARCHRKDIFQKRIWVLNATRLLLEALFGFRPEDFMKNPG